ncbi:MAG: ROK family protein [Deltaproteobacteria bacterium]|nr:MAG: ROK family protein [Deltaproteobacteria bacterium]
MYGSLTFVTNSSLIISVDLGGTNLRVGAVTPDGKIFDFEKRSSDSRAPVEKTLKNIEDAIRLVADRVTRCEKSIVGLVLGFPGIVDSKKGIVYQSPHFPSWKNLNFLEHFQKIFPWTVKADNDANLAALGETYFGAGKYLNNFVMITLGTGVGGGLILNRKIHHGDRGFAGEIGHFCIEGNSDRHCSCGSRGCWEMYVSTQGFHHNLDNPANSDDERLRDIFIKKLGKIRQPLPVARFPFSLFMRLPKMEICLRIPVLKKCLIIWESESLLFQIY